MTLFLLLYLSLKIIANSLNTIKHLVKILVIFTYVIGYDNYYYIVLLCFI